MAGEPTAKSYLLSDDNASDLRREGSQNTSPPIAAVRSFGRGRLFVYTVHAKHAFLNYGNRMWPQITESEGDRQAEKPSDGNRLLLGALRWLSEPALAVADLGTDEVLLYRLHAATATVTPVDPPFAKVEPGSGPRHAACSAARQHRYGR